MNSVTFTMLLVPLSHPLAAISDNALYVVGDIVQDITLIGQGAGEKPTASAVVEDLTNVYRVAPYAMPALRTIKVTQDRSIDRRNQYIHFQVDGLRNEKELQEIHSLIEQKGFQLKTFTWLYENEIAWVGFVCSNWEEERWTNCLTALPLPVNHFRIRPCLGEVSQTEKEPIMTPVS